MKAHNILENQNSDFQIALLKAATVSYTKAKSVEILISETLLFLSIAYPVSYLLIKDENAKLSLFAVSFVLSITVLLVKGHTSKYTTLGATIKELFDSNLFELPWKSTRKKPAMSEIFPLASSYRGSGVNNWYSIMLSPDLTKNVAIATLQYSNTMWDLSLRRIYNNWIKWFLIIYSVVLLGVFEISDTDIKTAFFTMFSLLSFYGHFIAIAQGNQRVITKRAEVAAVLDRLLTPNKDISNQEVVDIQDEIFITRTELAKVPNVVFRIYFERLKREDEQLIGAINMRFFSH